MLPIMNMREKYFVNSGIIFCQHCGHNFDSYNKLQDHMRIHTESKPLNCNTCKKVFKCSKQLKVHMKSHSQARCFTCDICGKNFGYKHVLKIHIATHFTEKIFKCNICELTFTNKKKLEFHIRSHSVALNLKLKESLCPIARPSSTGSLSSESSDKENFSAPPKILNYPPTNYIYPEELRQVNKMSQIRQYVSEVARARVDDNFILPSVHSVCYQRPEVVRNIPKAPSALAKASLPPITDNLISDLMREDQEKFGSEPSLSSASLYPSLSPSPSPPVSVSPAPSLCGMTDSNLPLRKRKLALFYDPSQSKERHSVIQFSGNR